MTGKAYGHATYSQGFSPVKSEQKLTSPTARDLASPGSLEMATEREREDIQPVIFIN